MKKSNIPQELTNIPFGQIFILTDPHQGITSKNTNQILSVISIAGKLGQSHIINALPVDDSELWDCFICKVKTDKGGQILISDNDSLVEMLCVFWGLDYDKVCKSLVLSDRYKKSVSLGGKSHPVRVSITTRKPGKTTETGDQTTSLQLITNHSRENTLGDIRSTFKDNFNFGLGISLDEIIALYKEEEKNKKSYKLHFDINWKDVKEYRHPKWVTYKKMKACDISLIDNFGNPYPIKIDAMTKAIYLTFLLFEDGIEYTQITYSDEFYDIFKQIYKKLPRVKGTPRRFNLDNKADLDTFTNYTSKTRQAILKVTNDTYAEEQFAIEGRKKDTYGIAGATADDRDKIRKEFNIK